ncbi:DegT/DnrJ/EryC1/StrS family aminotransferase [Luteibacter yeojuensis]|nr:DegT/DnrJ/EryC1/StrS family aminotransferase [Luteibacter yeojuensis]
MRRRFHEIPPSAGLPLRATDLLPRRGDLPGLLAGQLGIPVPLLTSSGTAALLIALATLKERAPDRRVVVVPAYTCPLVAIAVHTLGLGLRLCDTRPGHFDMDPEALARACTADTLAVIPTHLGGLVADTAWACTVAHAKGAWVIEDAAQALGAQDRGQSVGLRGDIGFFSLAAGKGLSIYEGGLLVASDPSLRMALHRTHDALVPRHPGWELRRCVELLGLAALYRPLGLGLAYGHPLRRHLRRGDAVAAVGDAFGPKIPLHRVGRWRQGVGTRAAARWPAFLARRRAQALARVARLQRIDAVDVLVPRADSEASWPLLLLHLPSEASRDAVLARLWTGGVGVSRLFVHALGDYAYLEDRVPQVATPNAREFASRTLTITNSPWLDDDLFENIASEIAGALRTP